MTDPIADMLTRIRNALQAKKPAVAMPYSRMKESCLQLLKTEGFISDYQVVGEGILRQLVVALKYVRGTQPVISGLKRISKPGLRVYRGFKELKQMAGGLGITFISTSKGVMTDRQAQESKAGGEVLLHIW